MLKNLICQQKIKVLLKSRSLVKNKKLRVVTRKWRGLLRAKDLIKKDFFFAKKWRFSQQKIIFLSKGKNLIKNINFLLRDKSFDKEIKRFCQEQKI